MCSFFYRFSIVNESYCCDFLCDPCWVIGCTSGIDINGCISGLLAGLVDNVSTCRWTSCCWAGLEKISKFLSFNKLVLKLSVRKFLQAILASAFAQNDRNKATAAASRVLQVLNHLFTDLITFNKCIFPIIT